MLPSLVRVTAGQNSKPAGLPLRSAMSPASVAMAISGGVLEPILTPIGRCTLATSLAGTPSSASAVRCGPWMPRIAHDANPARAARQRVTQLHAKLGPVMVGDDDVSAVAGDPVEASASSMPSVSAAFGPLRVRLHQNYPVPRVGAVTEQVAGDGRGEHRGEHLGCRWRRNSPVRNRAALVVHVPAVVAVPVIVAVRVIVLIVLRARHAYELATRAAAGQMPSRGDSGSDSGQDGNAGSWPDHGSRTTTADEQAGAAHATQCAEQD